MLSSTAIGPNRQGRNERERAVVYAGMTAVTIAGFAARSVHFAGGRKETATYYASFANVKGRSGALPIYAASAIFTAAYENKNIHHLAQDHLA